MAWSLSGHAWRRLLWAGPSKKTRSSSSSVRVVGSLPRDPEGCSAVLHGDHHRITLYVYVDNIAVVGTRKEEVEDGIRTVMNDMEACGLSSSEDGHACGATATSGPSHPPLNGTVASDVLSAGCSVFSHGQQHHSL